MCAKCVIAGNGKGIFVCAICLPHTACDGQYCESCEADIHAAPAGAVVLQDGPNTFMMLRQHYMKEHPETKPDLRGIPLGYSCEDAVYDSV